MRVLISSDLHVELTGLAPIRRLIAGMDREQPDLVVLAGDLGNPARLFEQCLACFLPLNCPVAVVPGNQDLWSGLGESSIRLYEEILPEITRGMGFYWLEEGPLVLSEGLALCGSIAWYDYSARDPSMKCGDEEISHYKAKCNLDAERIDWEFSDQVFAERCRHRIQRQLIDLEENDAVERIMVVTHVPLFESQIERHPDDEEWVENNPFFGHLTMGEALRGFHKVRWVVSGHTHMGLNGLVEREGIDPIATAVVPSDYFKPRWVTLEID